MDESVRISQYASISLNVYFNLPCLNSLFHPIGISWSVFEGVANCYVLPRYYLSLQMIVAQDFIYTTSSFIYSKILMILFSNWWWLLTAPFFWKAIPQMQDVNWTYIRRLEDVLDVFWTSYVRSIYVLRLRRY